ncbi:AraC-like DNA-binding protein [Orenia metallireducens]|uniref:AraC-type DNA-binding protein n=1 Tax=Orenia metallireducens TaxID=1413210 RepID=A0A285H487_9FIRM|nr:AraC family transcriptional regulator [Orenia metallireducens]PRX28579.1 AraC-like DNA-binding protein [Orenia metallireducens]SNY30555.1 AraC-type DNA-binding protein [Orenia metallireducens]
MLNNYGHQALDIEINRLNLTDMDIYVSGFQNCKTNHSFGPAVRDYFLVHYIYKGKGKFIVNNKTYYLSAGQGFLICPDIVTYYEADSNDPWTYAWIGFNGLKAKTYLEQANLTQDNPIFSTTEKENSIKKIFDKMKVVNDLKKGKELELLGLLYLFLSKLIKDNDNLNSDKENPKEIYLKEAIKYIHKNYNRYNLTVSQIAEYIGVDRTYLWSIFKSYLNLSPQQFLIEFRIDKACRLMKNKKLSIGDISRSVGYQDPLTFSKIFKKIKGVAPSKYKKETDNK